jgi:hypothetical protein
LMSTWGHSLRTCRYCGSLVCQRFGMSRSVRSSQCMPVVHHHQRQPNSSQRLLPE